MDYSVLMTEQVNQNTFDIDLCSCDEIVRLIHQEDCRAVQAVREELPQISKAIELIAAHFRMGGRLFYVGAGTSGRLGVLDASECPPTFGTDPQMVVGIIAGGEKALRVPIEGAEDSAEDGCNKIAEHSVCEKDVVVGISASGQAPFVKGAMLEAKRRKALVLALCCNRPADLSEAADLSILPVAGPEVLQGSTRMKAGTIQKLVLNMLSTGAMIRIGKTYHNLMVDLQPTNRKLKDRAVRIVMQAAGVSRREAENALSLAKGDTKAALLCLLTGCTVCEAQQRLTANDGVIRRVLQSMPKDGGRQDEE